MPIPVAAQSKAWALGLGPLPCWIFAGSNPTGGVDVCQLWILCVVR